MWKSFAAVPYHNMVVLYIGIMKVRGIITPKPDLHAIHLRFRNKLQKFGTLNILYHMVLWTNKKNDLINILTVNYDCLHVSKLHKQWCSQKILIGEADFAVVAEYSLLCGDCSQY